MNQENNAKNNEEVNNNQYEILKHLTRFVLSVKNISINYSENQGTFLPGYMNQPHFLGQEWSQMSPGLPLVIGSQKEIRYTGANNGWITKDTSLNSLYKTNCDVLLKSAFIYLFQPIVEVFISIIFITSLNSSFITKSK